MRLLPLAAALMLSATLAHADTYSYQLIYSSDGADFTAANDYGDYVYYDVAHSECEPYGGCYFSNINGVYSGKLDQAPTLPVAPAAAPGPGCNVTSAGYYTVATLCKNGYEFLLAYENPVVDVTSIYAASAPNTPLGYAAPTRFLMTDNGSLYFDSAPNDYLGRVLDFTTTDAALAAVTPEPSSIALLGTGVLGFAGLLRRRLA